MRLMNYICCREPNQRKWQIEKWISIEMNVSDSMEEWNGTPLITASVKRFKYICFSCKWKYHGPSMSKEQSSTSTDSQVNLSTIRMALISITSWVMDGCHGTVDRTTFIITDRVIRGNRMILFLLATISGADTRQSDRPSHVTVRQIAIVMINDHTLRQPKYRINLVK